LANPRRLSVRVPSAAVKPAIDTFAFIIQTTVDAVAAAVKAMFDTFALAVEAAIDTFTLVLQMSGQLFPAGSACPVRLRIEAVFNSVPAPIQALFDTLSFAIEAFINPVATVIQAVFDAVAEMIRAGVAGKSGRVQQQQGSGDSQCAFHFVSPCRRVGKQAPEKWRGLLHKTQIALWRRQKSAKKFSETRFARFQAASNASTAGISACVSGWRLPL